MGWSKSTRGIHHRNISAQPLYHPNPNREKERQDPNPNRGREERCQDLNQTKAHFVVDARKIITSRKLRFGEIDAHALINSMRKEREHTYQQPPLQREEVSYQSPLKHDQDKFEGRPEYAPFVFKTPLSARILATPNRSNVKIPNMVSFDGTQDPQEHVESYRAHMEVNTHVKLFFVSFFLLR